MTTFAIRTTRRSMMILFAFALTLYCGGCSATIPDVKPYADATLNLKNSTASVLEAVQESVGDAATAAPDDKKEAIKAEIEKLQHSSEVRVAALQAFVGYTNRLSAIAESAKTDQEKATAVKDAVVSLTNSFGSLFPNPIVTAATGGANAATAFVAEAVKVVIRLEASKNMGDALEKASPVVDLLSKALQKDFDDLEIQFQKNAEAIPVFARASEPEITTALKWAKAQRIALLGGIKDVNIPAATYDDLSRNDKLIKLLIDWSSDKFVTLAQGRADDGVKLIHAARSAIEEWAKAHSDLADAIKEGRQPNLTALAAAVAEVAKLTDEIRKSGVAIRAAQRTKENSK